MAIFPVIELESVVQAGDKTRISAAKSFVSKDNAAIAIVEIEPEAGAGFVAVTGSSSRDWYLDWVYTGATRTATVSVRITDATLVTPVVVTSTKTISVVTAVDDKLYSSDADIIALEPDILKWVPEGRSSFLNVHREAQIKIIDWLAEAGITDVAGDRLDKSRIVDVDEVRSWSKYLVLSLVFRGIYNSVDDVFSDKAKFYETMAKGKADRAKLRLDLDGDGETSTAEDVNLQSRDLVRE